MYQSKVQELNWFADHISQDTNKLQKAPRQEGMSYFLELFFFFFFFCQFQFNSILFVSNTILSQSQVTRNQQAILGGPPFYSQLSFSLLEVIVTDITTLKVNKYIPYAKRGLSHLSRDRRVRRSNLPEDEVEELT